MCLEAHENQLHCIFLQRLFSHCEDCPEVDLEDMLREARTVANAPCLHIFHQPAAKDADVFNFPEVAAPRFAHLNTQTVQADPFSSLSLPEFKDMPEAAIAVERPSVDIMIFSVMSPLTGSKPKSSQESR